MSLNQIEKEQMMQFVQERTAEACLRRTEKRMKLVLLTLMRKLWSWRRGLILLLTPIFFVFIPILMNGKAGRCLYVVTIMAIFWTTEVIPMAATALLPVSLIPLLGVMDGRKVAANYLKDTNFLFVGGLIVAVAIEKWGLHKRIALKVLLLIGAKPCQLICGFMLTTAFVSMWISNTATTAMMVPIAYAVISELKEAKRIRRQSVISGIKPSAPIEDDSCNQNKEVAKSVSGCQCEDGAAISPTHNNNWEPSGEVRVTMADNSKIIYTEVTQRKEHLEQEAEDNKKETLPLANDNSDNFAKCVTLSIAYAANIGGTGSIMGTGTNILLKGQLDIFYKGKAGVTVNSWFVYAFPNMLVILVISYLWLVLFFLGFRELATWRKKKTLEEERIVAVLKAEYVKLGSAKYEEICIMILFIILVILWLTRDPGFMPGWGSLLGHNYVTDATVAMTIAISLFLLPNRPLCCAKRSVSPMLEKTKKVALSENQVEEVDVALLDWPTVQKHLPWNVIILIGGGMALAEACQESGLSNNIADLFRGMDSLPTSVLVFVLSAAVAGFTEVASNVAVVTLFLPILAQLAVALHVNPLYLMIPITIASSFAFMLPVATPPNAIIFSYGYLKTWDMIKVGIVMNVICVLVLQLSISSWGYAYFNLGHYPIWADMVLQSVTTGPSSAMFNVTTVSPLNMCNVTQS